MHADCFRPEAFTFSLGFTFSLFLLSPELCLQNIVACNKKDSRSKGREPWYHPYSQRHALLPAIRTNLQSPHDNTTNGTDVNPRSGSDAGTSFRVARAGMLLPFLFDIGNNPLSLLLPVSALCSRTHSVRSPAPIRTTHRLSEAAARLTSFRHRMIAVNLLICRESANAL